MEFVGTANKQESFGDEWVLTSFESIDAEWMKFLFPGKETSKIEKWVSILQENEFESIEELKGLDTLDWKALPLPLAIKTGIKQYLANSQEDSQAFLNSNDGQQQVGAVDSGVLQNSSETASRNLIDQVDIVVIDISRSMKARSNIDVDKTREDVSKMLFHTMMDKLVSLELEHAVGLLAFGQHITPKNITREYELFHDELGRLDANEGRTKLYDSILSAADMINEYTFRFGNEINNDSLQKRIFVLTDGQDNASISQPWKVSQTLQQMGIVLDAIPLAGANGTLQAMSLASGGMCFNVVSQYQGMLLFENEATLHLSFREESASRPPTIQDEAAYESFRHSLVGSKETESVTEIRTVIPQTAFAKVHTTESIKKAKAKGGCNSSAGSAATKRILREYDDYMKDPQPNTFVFMNADDVTKWKAVITDLPVPYENGTWVLTIEFPTDFPFKPMKIRFITPIFHCNISSGGGICLDILKSNWSPALTITKVLIAIRILLTDPNPDDPMDAFKGQLCRDNKEEYMQRAQDHTLQHAGDTLAAVLENYNLS
mmetsp:Transcript_31046/g.41027  ORF Transcript_31046/g.41027 Transcript_31046/m.41027 type:complete len:547 (+) Transcript_31046:50-1690(+)|eukprot:CAMPEP_0117786024 /NCGR_PEP_ID=MMETSP0948-20121206/5610_1 /TAXON_ID=44440 /ORGANISM="Chattonella subsalsa, Strain CCMP2191" /LENGTH=546 /DNA_ID=CAMNT_0005614997 /DNA_START=24 /DNA_END=1664 /DNA_ORIENTATION=+